MQDQNAKDNPEIRKHITVIWQNFLLDTIRIYKRSILLVGPPILTTIKGFGKGANSSCQTIAALRSAAESTRCRAPIVRT